MERLPFEDVVRQHYPKIARIALILSGDPWEAEDLVQEVFLVAHRRYEGFVARGSVLAWLYGILRNLHRKSSRRRRGRISPERRRESGGDPLEGILRDEAHARLWRALSELSPKLREALLLKYVEGLPQEAIAQVLGVPLGTVKSRIGAGLFRLRRLLGLREAPKGERCEVSRGVEDPPGGPGGA